MAERAPHYGRLMEHLKREPCLVRGTTGVDAAHLSPLVRRGPSGPRIRKSLDRAGRSHNGWIGLVAVPLSPDLHRPTSEYPHALDRAGLEAFLERHGLTEAEVAWEVVRILAKYIAQLPE